MSLGRAPINAPFDNVDLQLPPYHHTAGITTQTFTTTVAEITAYKRTFTPIARQGASAQPILFAVGLSFYTGTVNSTITVQVKVSSGGTDVYGWSTIGTHWYNLALHRCVWGARTFTSLIVAGTTYDFHVGAFTNATGNNLVSHDGNDWATVVAVEL